jgi:hypothetical protein
MHYQKMQRKLFSFHGNHLRGIFRHIHDLIYFPQGKSFILVPGCRLAQASKPDGFKCVRVRRRLELSSSDFDVVWI